MLDPMVELPFLPSLTSYECQIPSPTPYLLPSLTSSKSSMLCYICLTTTSLLYRYCDDLIIISKVVSHPFPHSNFPMDWKANWHSQLWVCATCGRFQYWGGTHNSRKSVSLLSADGCFPLLRFISSTEIEKIRLSKQSSRFIWSSVWCAVLSQKTIVWTI